MSRANLVFVSQKDTFTDLNPFVSEYTIVTVRHLPGYMSTLIKSQAAMIFIDGSHTDWKRLITASKTSPATRRIPIILVTNDANKINEGIVAGADLTFGVDDLKTQIGKVIQDFGRISAPQLLDELNCECGKQLPPLAVEGVRKFNAGEYYAQHDLFEKQWIQTKGAIRDLYRAILQVGVAYFQIERRNYRGALKMLQRSVQWLAILPDVCQGIDITSLRQDSYRVRAELERLGEERFDEFDLNLLKPIKIDE